MYVVLYCMFPHEGEQKFKLSPGAILARRRVGGRARATSRVCHTVEAPARRTRAFAPPACPSCVNRPHSTHTSRLAPCLAPVCWPAPASICRAVGVLHPSCARRHGSRRRRQRRGRWWRCAHGTDWCLRDAVRPPCIADGWNVRQQAGTALAARARIWRTPRRGRSRHCRFRGEADGSTRGCPAGASRGSAPAAAAALGIWPRGGEDLCVV